MGKGRRAGGKGEKRRGCEGRGVVVWACTYMIHVGVDTGSVST